MATDARRKFRQNLRLVFFPSWLFVAQGQTLCSFIFHLAAVTRALCTRAAGHPCSLVSGLFQGNGHEEVVACAWDGQTYIIDHNRTVVRFQVDENIRAFCAGGSLARGPSLTTLVRLSCPLSPRPLTQVHKQTSSSALV